MISDLQKITKPSNDSSESGENLVFLISQPRAGSTLLQRILGNHSDIQTAPEPWLMLHPLYALKETGYQAEYSSVWFKMAAKDFLKTLPGGEDLYYEGVRKMHSHLYQLALNGSDKQYFLDKTPRYFHVIPELYKTFPKAKFIILLRNPLAVLCSMITTWVKEREHWSFLGEFEPDLLSAPNLLLEATQLIPSSNCIQVSYESLIAEPDKAVHNICSFLGLPYSEELLKYDHVQSKGFGYSEQKKNVNKSGRPKVENLKKWIEELDDPQIWRLASDYLDLLDKNIIVKMGYSYEELLNLVANKKPSKLKAHRTIPLQWLLDRPVGVKRWKYYVLRLDRSLRKMTMKDVLVRLKSTLKN